MINAPTKATLSEPATASGRFPPGGGETGELIRSFNWSATPLGRADQWSQSLKTCIQILLSSAQPMLLCWGNENIFIYNDACRELLGHQHPLSMGQPAATVWPALWSAPEAAVITPQLRLMQPDGSCYQFNGMPVKDDTGDSGILFTGASLYNGKAPTFVKTDLSNFTRTLLEQLDPVIREAGLTLVINLGIVSEDVYIDRDIWEQILLSLLTNALSYTLQGGVAVRLSQENNQVILSIADTGIGITPGLLSEINAALQGPPRSLDGLTVANEGILLHGGGLQISSIPGEGSIFTISIPAGHAHLPAAEVVHNAVPVHKAYHGYLPHITSAIRMCREKLRQQHAGVHYQLLEALPAAIVEFSDDAIISKTLDGIVTSWNPGAERLFGYTAEEMKGEAITRIIPADRLDEEPRIIEQLKAGNRVDHFETKRVTKDGQLLDISLTISPVKDLYGNVIGASKIARDITQQKKLFQALQESESQYMQLAVKLEAIVEQRTKELVEANFYLEKSNRELEQFAYVTSHDLQEPLRKIHTFAGMLFNVNKDILSETSRMYIEKIMQSAKRMSLLISELLDYSRLVHVKDPFVETDLNEILKNVLTDFEVIISQHDVTITAKELPRLTVSPLQMNQLFYNLIGNAIKFLSPGRKPQIRIYAEQLSAADLAVFPDLEKGRDYCAITVTDNGIGFDQVYANKIFQIFQRLNDRAVYEGTGIGLALCNKIVLNHKGGIYATGIPDKGAVFRVILPA